MQETWINETNRGSDVDMSEVIPSLSFSLRTTPSLWGYRYRAYVTPKFYTDTLIFRRTTRSQEVFEVLTYGSSRVDASCLDRDVHSARSRFWEKEAH